MLACSSGHTLVTNTNEHSFVPIHRKMQHHVVGAKIVVENIVFVTISTMFIRIHAKYAGLIYNHTSVHHALKSGPKFAKNVGIVCVSNLLIVVVHVVYRASIHHCK